MQHTVKLAITISIFWSWFSLLESVDRGMVFSWHQLPVCGSFGKRHETDEYCLTVAYHYHCMNLLCCMRGYTNEYYNIQNPYILLVCIWLFVRFRYAAHECDYLSYIHTAHTSHIQRSCNISICHLQIKGERGKQCQRARKNPYRRTRTYSMGRSGWSHMPHSVQN